MDASAIIDYFAPLKAWLDDQIKGQPIGWDAPAPAAAAR
jgi:peptidyl-dipeptidase A